MRDYAKFAGTFWTRGSGKRLRGQPEAQVLATYLMTAPQANMIGLYYLPLVTIAHETGLSERVVRSALAKLAEPDIDIAHYDEEAELVWLPAMASYQIAPELKPGDRRRGGPIIAEATKIGAHPFTRAFWDRYGVAFGLEAYPFKGQSAPSASPIDAPSHAPPKGDEAHSGRAREEQEQEQAQEQEQEQAQVTAGKPSGSDVARRVFRYYAEQRAFHLGARCTVQVTEPRLRLIRARLKEGFTEDDLLRAVDGLFASPWNMGENDRHTKYVEPEHVFREAAQVERHRATAEERAPRRPPDAPPAPERVVVSDPAEIDRLRKAALSKLDEIKRKQAPFLFDDADGETKPATATEARP